KLGGSWRSWRFYADRTPGDRSLPRGADCPDISPRNRRIQPPLRRSSPCSWCTERDQTEFAPDCLAEAVPEKVHRGSPAPSRIVCRRCRIGPANNAPSEPAADLFAQPDSACAAHLQFFSPPAESTQAEAARPAHKGCRRASPADAKAH